MVSYILISTRKSEINGVRTSQATLGRPIRTGRAYSRNKRNWSFLASQGSSKDEFKNYWNSHKYHDTAQKEKVAFLNSFAVLLSVIHTVKQYELK